VAPAYDAEKPGGIGGLIAPKAKRPGVAAPERFGNFKA
jgi:hypothetical protein